MNMWVMKMGKRDELNKPITANEIAEARRKCQVGDKVRVFNLWRANFKRDTENYGRLEESRIAKKFRYMVQLENGRCVDYAEIAMQRRIGEK